MPKELTNEWMHRLERDGWVTRVWTKRTEPQDKAEWREQHGRILAAIEEIYGFGESAFNAIARLEFVTAVEELNPNGHGRVAYVDWP